MAGEMEDGVGDAVERARSARRPDTVKCARRKRRLHERERSHRWGRMVAPRMAEARSCRHGRPGRRQPPSTHRYDGSDRRDDDGRGGLARRNRDAVVGDVAFVNGTFIDGRGVVASAMTIRNGRIANVGRLESVGADTPVVNLHGRTVIPGLIDSHVHYTRAGVNPGYEARRIERAFSILELQETIAQRARSVPRGAFITCVGGWNHTQFVEARRPTKAELDEAAPRHAVYISGTGGGTGAITNSLGQAFFTARGIAVDRRYGGRSRRHRHSPRSRPCRRRRTSFAARSR